MFSDICDPNQKTSTRGIQNLFGQLIPHGTSVYILETAIVDDKTYRFRAFSIYKVYEDSAKNLQEQAIQFLGHIKAQKRGDQHKTYDLIGGEDNNEIWKFFSFLIGSIIFSYAALEAYTNEIIETRIGADFKHPELVKKQKHGEILLPIKDIIRECSLEDKLFKVLPLYYKTASFNKLKANKSIFKTLQFLRNEAVHLKQTVIRTSNSRSSKFWNNLIPRFNAGNKTLRFHPYNVYSTLLNSLNQAINLQE